MSHDPERLAPSKQNIDPIPSRPPHYDGAASPNPYDDPASVYRAIEALAKDGRGSKTDLAASAASLPFEYKTQVRDLIPQLAKRISGDELMQVAAVVDDRVDFSIHSALTASPPISAGQLKRHLKSLDAERLQWLADDSALFARIRTILPGPFGAELPLLAMFPPALHAKPLFVRWYLETTDSTVAAVTLAYGATAALAKSLDELRLWSWLDHLHIGRHFYFGAGLERLRDATSDAAAKSKLEHMLTGFNSEKVGSDDHEAGQRDLKRNLENKTDNAALLDAAARGWEVQSSDNEAAQKRLAGESAAVILEFASATNLKLEIAIPLLASAKGVTPAHVQSLLLMHEVADRVGALKTPSLRAAIRKVLGRQEGLTHLFPSVKDREDAHAAIYTDEALREWAYQEKNPTTNLWIAAGSNHAKDACHLVRRDVGFDWVHQLTPSAPGMELRRLALYAGDPKVSELIHTHLFGERTFKVNADDNLVGMLPGDVYGNTADGRVKQEIHKQDANPKQILERLGDLSASERAAALTNRAEMTEMFTALSGAEAVRAVFLLAPTIPQLFSLPILNEPGLLDYLRSRPVEEEHQAVTRGSLVRPARALFQHTCPFIVYPSLYDTQTLAKALDKSDELLEWILEETEPSLALARLSMEPARTMAVPRFEARPQLYDKLPAYKHLLPKGRQGFDAIAKQVEDEDSKRDAKLYQAGDAQVDEGIDRRAQKMATADGEKHLWDALESIAHSHGGEASALALIQRAPAKEQIELLAGTHTATVETLKQMTGRSPQHLFPALSTAQLLALPDAAAWMFEMEPAYSLLSRLQGDAVKQLGTILSTDDNAAKRFINHLPDSAALTAHERQALDSLCAAITNEAVLRGLFKVRYGAVVDETYALAETKKLWNVLARLPPAQVNQHVIRDFTHGNIGASASGEWYQREVILDKDPKTLEGNETSYENAAELSAADIKKYYGLDDKGLETASKENGWIEKLANGLFKVKPITDTPSFTATVLHEVGHSVDELLGEHTDLIYGKGGWKKYGVDQFEEWATEMGGIKNRSGRDRADVITAWKESLRAGKPVAEMVDAQHPAMHLEKDDPLAKHATDAFHYTGSRHEDYGGRVYMTNGVHLTSVAKATADVAPSSYAMSAPAEYFAECYVEYYRGYKGTPDTEKNKGGHLATWIKQWFDTHVDNVRLSPERLNGKPDNGAAARPAKKA